MARRTLLVFVLVGAAAVVAGALLARLLADHPVTLDSGTALPQPRALAPFALADLTCRPFGPAQLTGAPSWLFFGFTNCPDVCPTTLATLAQLARLPTAAHPRVVFVSVDPGRDSAANLKVYLGAFDRDFIGVRGDEGALAPLLRTLGAIAVRQPLPGGSYTMDHSATLYLLDSQGRLAAVFSPPFSAARLAADLNRVAAAHRL